MPQINNLIKGIYAIQQRGRTFTEYDGAELRTGRVDATVWSKPSTKSRWEGMVKLRNALIVGGNSGIGLGVTVQLLRSGVEHIDIIGRHPTDTEVLPADVREDYQKKTDFHSVDLTWGDYSVFDSIGDVDALFISAGFGRVALFEELTENEIERLVKCNELAVMQIIRKYYDHINSDVPFYCGIMVSIAGHVVSPFFSVYGGAKAGLSMFIENINCELEANHRSNRILDCSPGSIAGTSFSGKRTDVEQLAELSKEILSRMTRGDTLFIPSYDDVYKAVIDRYHADPNEYGQHSYQYKLNSGRVQSSPQTVIGFLSGTFDLFHIGHLNLLRRAKENCDYLIVAVHESGAWKGKSTFIGYEERVAIIRSIKYVDLVVEDYREDIDAWPVYHYNKLFVGSDYQGTERFNRYEEYFKDKDAEIVYFPYTEGTSSTQLRQALSALQQSE